MKMIIVLSALVAIAAAAPQHHHHQQEVHLVRETQHDNIGLPNGYAYDYQLSDGSSKQEQGQFEDAHNEHGEATKALVQTGSYSFVADDGQQYTVQYIADKDGFRASGAHLPQPPQ